MNIVVEQCYDKSQVFKVKLHECEEKAGILHWKMLLALTQESGQPETGKDDKQNGSLESSKEDTEPES